MITSKSMLINPLVLVHGNKSGIFQKYFGKGPTATPMGWFDKIASGNRAGIVFRCDDPDRNCETQDGKHTHPQREAVRISHGLTSHSMGRSLAR